LRNRGRKVIISDINYPKKILGIDCSSATVGGGLVGIEKEQIELAAYGHIKPLKPNYNLMIRLDDIYDRIVELCEELKPDYVVVEDIIQFMGGMSQAKTIIMLASFNRIVSLAAYRESKVNVELYSVQHIRKLIRKQINKPEAIKKDEMPEIVKNYLCSKFKFALNRKGAVAKEAGDEADAIAVAWAYAIEKNEKSL
jgi:Holliday junction resolvasome RuvABC endonuclease subunit